jgi:hypothetical protein
MTGRAHDAVGRAGKLVALDLGGGDNPRPASAHGKE